jgi:hypothetical protein
MSIRTSQKNSVVAEIADPQNSIPAMNEKAKSKTVFFAIFSLLAARTPIAKRNNLQ